MRKMMNGTDWKIDEMVIYLATSPINQILNTCVISILCVVHFNKKNTDEIKGMNKGKNYKYVSNVAFKSSEAKPRV